jgi:hypothetical protein
MAEVGIQEPAYSVMREYFERASTFMINTSSEDDDLMQWRPSSGETS